jgi:hypothetical protein
MGLAGDEERRPPVAIAVLGQLKVPALTVHPDGDEADTVPVVEPAVEQT